MANLEVVVAIPIYKDELNENEIHSITQCVTILGSYPIFFVAPLNLKAAFYNRQYGDIPIKRFPDKYFMDINGYNKLLLQPLFYNSFSNYTYLLIYQPDAWVFKDELGYWCKSGFDFIGAPWFEGFAHGNNEARMIGVGNGGFSLRNIHKAKKILYSFRYITTPINILKNRVKQISGINSLINQTVKILLDLTIRNNTFYLFNNFSGNEDEFWSVFASSKFKWYKIPSPEIAMLFSFECNPAILFEKTKGRLPFGCHRWEIYDNKFWKIFIKY